MKIKIQNNSRRKTILIASLAVLLLLAGLTTYAYVTKISIFSKEDQTSQQDNTNLNTPVNPQDEKRNTSDNPDKTPIRYGLSHDESGDNQSSDSDSEITGIINYKAVSGDSLVIRTTIDNRIETGTCILTLTNSSARTTVTRTANIMPNPSTSTCEGFNIPLSEVGTGKWNIVITVKSNGIAGKIEDSVTI